MFAMVYTFVHVLVVVEVVEKMDGHLRESRETTNVSDHEGVAYVNNCC